MRTQSDKTTTWFPWSGVRLLSTFHRACWKFRTRKPVNPSSATKKTKSSTIWRSRGVRLQGSPSNWTEILSFNKFVFILAVAAEQWMDVESKLGLLAIFNLDWTVKFFVRNQHRETCGCTTRSGSDNIFLLFRQLFFFFRLLSTFSSQAIDGRCEQNTFPHCMYRHKHFVRTSHMMLHAHAWLKLCLPSTIVSLSCHLSRAMSFDPHRTPPLLFSTLPSSTSSTLSGSCSTSFQPRACADPHGRRGDGFDGIRTSHMRSTLARVLPTRTGGGRRTSHNNFMVSLFWTLHCLLVMRPKKSKCAGRWGHVGGRRLGRTSSATEGLADPGPKPTENLHTNAWEKLVPFGTGQDVDLGRACAKGLHAGKGHDRRLRMGM